MTSGTRTKTVSGFQGQTARIVFKCLLGIRKAPDIRRRCQSASHRGQGQGSVRSAGSSWRRRPGSHVRLRQSRDRATSCRCRFILLTAWPNSLAAVRRCPAPSNYLRPDGKTQVTVAYQGTTPVHVERILISTQHEAGISLEDGQMRGGPLRNHVAQGGPAVAPHHRWRYRASL